MMYHCIAIAVGFPSDAKDFEDVSHPSLHQPIDDRQKHAEEKDRGNYHRRGRNHVILTWPRYLLHFHAHVVQEFARVRDRSGNSLADARGRSRDGVAARLVVLHFYRLRGHETLFTSRNGRPSRSVLLIPLARWLGASRTAPRGRQTLAGEEGFEPPYPVLETGVLTVGRLPFTPSPRSGTRGLPPSHQLQLLDSAPTFNLLLQLPRRFALSAALAPNQLNRPAFRGVPRSYAPVMPLHPRLHVVCNSDVERAVPAPHHVAEPTLFLCHAASGFPGVISLPCAPCACGTNCRTFSSPNGRSASSCFLSSCSCGFCNPRTAT